MTKPELRGQIRCLKRQMSEEDIVNKSKILCSRFLTTDAYQKAQTIYGYLSYNQEVRTMPILEQALRDGKKVALPKCYGPEMRFIYVEDLTRIRKSSCGVPEPLDDVPIADDETALVLMPGMAFDQSGHRMGYGGGYYDRFLSAQPHHPTIALCYDFQVVEQLPTDAFDIPVDQLFWA